MEENIRDAQKELAELAIKNGLLQLSLWDQNCRVDEIEVEELSESVLPSATMADFQRYLDSFSGIDEIQRQNFSNRTYSLDYNPVIREDLPKELFEGDFCLENPTIWEFVFQDQGSGWVARANEMESLQDELQSSILHKVLERDEILQNVTKLYRELAELVADLFNRIKSERSSLREIFGDMKHFCEQCSLLKRKKKNLENVLCILCDIVEVYVLLEDVSTMLESNDATELHHAAVFDAYDDLQRKLDGLKGHYLSIESLKNHGLAANLSKGLLRSLHISFRRIILEDIVELDQEDQYHMIAKALTRLLDAHGDSNRFIRCMNKHFEEVVDEKVCLRLNQQERDQAYTSWSNAMSTCLKQINDAYKVAELLSNVSLDILSRSMRIDEHCRMIDTTGLGIDFVEESSSYLAKIWGEFFVHLTQILSKEQVKPLDLKGIIDFYNSVESTCSSLGAAETVSGKIQDFCGTILENLSDNSVQYLKRHMYEETWEYMSDVSLLAPKLVDLLGTSSSETQIVTEEHPGKLLISGRYYGLIGSISILVDYLMYLKEYSIVFTHCARQCYAKAGEILKIFNQMTYQLILGAGAIHLSKLNSITVKHLSISCEQITLILYLATNIQRLFLDETQRQDHGPENEFEKCIDDMVSHRREIKEKIVNVACDLMIPLMKDATICLSSHLKNGADGQVVIPEFIELIDAMLRNFAVVSKIVRKSLGTDEVNTMLESIWEESIVWIKDAALSYGSDDAIVANVYFSHMKYIQSKLETIYPAKCVSELIMNLESMLHG